MPADPRDPRIDPRPGDVLKIGRSIRRVEGGHSWGNGSVKWSTQARPNRLTVLLDLDEWRRQVARAIVITVAPR